MNCSELKSLTVLCFIPVTYCISDTSKTWKHRKVEIKQENMQKKYTRQIVTLREPVRYITLRQDTFTAKGSWHLSKNINLPGRYNYFILVITQIYNFKFNILKPLSSLTILDFYHTNTNNW